MKPITDQGKSFGSQTMFVTVQTGLQRAAEQQYSSAGYRPLSYTRPRPEPVEETAIHVMLASGLMKILAAYLSPSRPLFEADLFACLSGWLPVLMAGDLITKHVDWNSRLITPRGRRLRDYANVIPVWFMGRTHPPLSHITPLLPPMS
jgi:hypothetical protein